MILLAKVITLVFGLIVISKTVHDFKKKQENLTMFLFWLVVWIFVIILSIFPVIIERINTLVGEQGNGVNTFLGVSFVFLLFVSYRIYVKANRLERKIHNLVMKLGLRDIENR